MSWGPNHDDITANAELDWCRDAAGEVLDEGQVIAHVALEVEVWWTQVGGHLWWRRWASGEEVDQGYWTGLDGWTEEWLSQPSRHSVDQQFLSDLKNGRYVIRNYEAPGTSADGGPVIAEEHEVRWLEEPQLSVARRRARGG